MKFRIFTALALTAVLLSCGGGEERKGGGQNILLIVLDAARADHFSCYGYSRPTTPHIDRIAGEGERFTMAFSTSSWTLPAHASLFTGLLPDEHKTNSRHAWLIDRIPTLAELLSQNGYRTAAFSNNPFVDKAQNLHRGFDRFEEIWADSTVTDSIHPYDTPHTNRLVEAFIDSCAGGTQPFFTFINYMDSHMPYNPPGPFRTMYLGEPPADSARMDSLCRYSEMLNAGDIVPDEDERVAVMDIYDGALTYLDSQVGELLDYLRGKALLDNTLLIILSDHGEVYGDEGHFTHGILLSRPLVQIALIVRDPALIAGGVVRDEPVSITDIFHSIAKLTGFTGAPSGEPARYLFGGPIAAAPCYSKLYAGREAVESTTHKDLSSLVETSKRHFIYCPSTSWDCYDLAADFDETTNLVPSLVSRAGVEQVFGEFEKNLLVLKETREDLTIRSEMEVAQKQVQAMRALGYVGSGVSFDKVHPHTAEHLTAGSRYYLRGDYNNAEREIRDALLLDSNNKEARRYLGFTLYRQGKLGEATGVLRSLTGTDGDTPLVRMVLGRVLEKLGRRDEALQQYLASCRMQPGDAAVVIQTAGMLLAAGRDSEADSLVARMLPLHEAEPEVLDAATGTYITAGRWPQAEHLLLRAVKNGRTESRLNNLALCALKQKKYGEARKYLEELLKMDITPQQRRNYRLQLDALAKK